MRLPNTLYPLGGTVAAPLPYVADGLVAWWDGIWNAGLGVHDASATAWKDLVGDRTLSARVSGFSWGDSYGAFNGTEIRANINLGPIAAMEAVLVFPAARLNQIVVRGTGNWTRDYKLYIGSNGYDIAAGVNGEYNLWGNKISDGVTPHSCHYQFPGTTDRFYLDGRLGGSRSSSKYATATSALTFFPSNAANVGRVYCVRFYNRALTAAEVAANYAVDKERFGL